MNNQRVSMANSWINYFRKVRADSYPTSRGFSLTWHLAYNEQGAKKVISTACHSGKLKLTFTSPNIFSTSPKCVLMSRLISQFFCNLNSSKNFICPWGKLITEFTSPIAKSTGLGHYFLCTLNEVNRITCQLRCWFVLYANKLRKRLHKR